MRKRVIFARQARQKANAVLAVWGPNLDDFHMGRNGNDDDRSTPSLVDDSVKIPQLPPVRELQRKD